MGSAHAMAALVGMLALGALALEVGAVEDTVGSPDQVRGAGRPSRPLLRGQAAEVTVADVETNLVAQLAGNVSSSRLQELEAMLGPMHDSLPKEGSGLLGHQAVRYALHRLLLQRHGWFIVGLEPTEEALPPYLHSEWVPQYLQGLLEQRLGDRGLDLREVAALAAVLEDLVRAEASRRLDLVLELLHVRDGARLTNQGANRVMETYMMMYLDGTNLTAISDLDQELADFKQQYSDWASAASWMRRIKGRHVASSSDNKLGRAEMVSIANELGERFGVFNDGECQSLKGELMGMEGPRPGRVPLLDFYKKGLYSHWQFNERVDYLRSLGALDESDELQPSVIVPNYLGSRPNCLTASGLYAVCCRNECEDLMGHLEREIGSPAAPPRRILALVSDLPSATVNASRKLPESLAQRLQGIAERHGGQVPLHGRLFAQWMHHAYPRECPYPHEGGVNPQTPDEWMREAGAEQEARASEAEVRKILADGAHLHEAPAGAASSGSGNAELPWSDAEVLLAKGPPRTASSDPWEVMVKAVILVVLVALLSIHQGSSRNKKRMAGNLDFADLEEPEKPCGLSQRLQPWVVLLAFLAVCATLEATGLLDRFSFCCMLLGGLLLNLVVPLLVRRARPQGLKPGKYHD